jgi:hypothetical protein
MDKGANILMLPCQKEELENIRRNVEHLYSHVTDFTNHILSLVDQIESEEYDQGDDYEL